MWSKISSALKPRDGNDGDTDHSDAQSSGCSPPDPFCANATTYYTHQEPHSPSSGGHSRTASREEDVIWSLRTQLALRQELCAQFEIDLGARDELVEALTIRLAASEKENDKRKNIVRSWKKKAADLERMCRHLEEEVGNSRQESMERSIMDEASGEALRQLHRQISQLERERNSIEAERNSLAQAVTNAGAEMSTLRERLGAADETGGEAVRQLYQQISHLEQEKNDVEVERDALTKMMQKAEVEIAKLRGDLSVTGEASAEALRQLHGQISQLEQEKKDLLTERDALVQARERSDAEALALQNEFTAAEETHREALRRLHDQISRLEWEKNDIEVERSTLAEAMDNAKADVFRLKEELDVTSKINREAQQQLRDQVSQIERERGRIEAERGNFSSEISELRAHIQQLQKDSAVLEVTIVQLNKQLDQNKEDINGLNIALESKQQELELVKRKHATRGAVGPTPGRTSATPSTNGKLATHAGQPSRISRPSMIGSQTSPPIPQRVPSALGRSANTRPPVTNGLRRTSSSSVESKPKLSSRRVSVTSMLSESDEKENASTPVSLNNPRRAMVPA